MPVASGVSSSIFSLGSSAYSATSTATQMSLVLVGGTAVVNLDLAMLQIGANQNSQSS